MLACNRSVWAWMFYFSVEPRSKMSAWCLYSIIFKLWAFRLTLSVCQDMKMIYSWPLLLDFINMKYKMHIDTLCTLLVKCCCFFQTLFRVNKVWQTEMQLAKRLIQVEMWRSCCDRFIIVFCTSAQYFTTRGGLTIKAVHCRFTCMCTYACGHLTVYSIN